MSKLISKVVKSFPRKMVKRTRLWLNSKMVKSFLGRSTSNFGSNQLTPMVYAMQDHNWKISAAKTPELSKLPLFMSENKNVVGEKSKF